MLKRTLKQLKRDRRHKRVRSRIAGTAACPRVTIFRSLHGISLQVIDDTVQKTLTQANFSELKKNAKNDVASAKVVGKILGERMEKLNIKKAVYDRAGYLYHGKVKAAAEGIRECGIVM